MFIIINTNQANNINNINTSCNLVVMIIIIHMLMPVNRIVLHI
jgi:hypothetical protein